MKRALVIGLNAYSIMAAEGLRSAGHHVEFAYPVLGGPGDSTYTNLQPVATLDLIPESINFDLPTYRFRAFVLDHDNWEKKLGPLARAGIGVPPTDRVILPTDMWVAAANAAAESCRFIWGGLDAWPALWGDGAYDIVINTMPRDEVCLLKDDHTFSSAPVWWSATKGPQTPDMTVVLSGGPDTAWIYSRNIGGEKITIWPKEPPFSDVETFRVPIKTTCNCWPDLIHLGRVATYTPQTLEDTYLAAAAL